LRCAYLDGSLLRFDYGHHGFGHGGCGGADGCARSAGAGDRSISAPSAALDAQLSLIEMQMMGAVKAMPAEKYGFAPSAGIFAAAQKTEFATVRTFGQQVAHVAEAKLLFL